MMLAPNLKAGFFAPHQLDDLSPNETPVDHVRRLMPQAGEAQVRARVAQMGLATEKMATAAKDLSGGEKARLLMGLSAFHAPNLLILDEPTNHLDIDSRRALIEALNDYDGAVILISHDRYLIEATVDRLWLVNEGTVKPFEGDMEEYRDLIIAAGRKKDDKPQGASDEPANRAEQRKANAERRASLAPLKKKINEIESVTAKLEKLIQQLDAELADPVLYEKAPARAAEKARQRGEAAAKLANAEEQWLELSAEYEEAMAG